MKNSWKVGETVYVIRVVASDNTMEFERVSFFSARNILSEFR